MYVCLTIESISLRFLSFPFLIGEEGGGGGLGSVSLAERGGHLDNLFFLFYFNVP